MEENTKVVIVWNKKTKKIVPFVYGDKGEIIITSTDLINDNNENVVVSKMNINNVDFFTGYVLEEQDAEKI